MTINDDKVAEDGGGKRHDAGKPRTDLLPPDALLELSKVYAAGALQYSDRNWERGMPWSKVVGPMLRHTFKRMMGEVWDKEDKGEPQRHTAKIAWNAIAWLTYELRGIGTDDVSRN